MSVEKTQVKYSNKKVYPQYTDSLICCIMKIGYLRSKDTLSMTQIQPEIEQLPTDRIHPNSFHYINIGDKCSSIHVL